jgi:putative ABC transport system permease protein
MHEFLLGFRHAVRQTRRAPGFAALAVTVLAVGIGASTLMFGLVDAALLRDLPFRDPARVMWMYNTRTERDRAPLSIPDVDDYRREATTLSGLALFTNWTANLTGAGLPERLDGTRVSGSFFPLLGVEPWIGRGLQPEDESSDARVVVLTYGLWIRRFGGRADIVGREISLNGARHTVVGVLPPRFLFPFREAELAVPLTTANDPRRSDRGANFLRVVARLAPGVSVAQAKAQLDGIARRLQREYPDENARKIGISLYSLHDEIVRDYRTILWTLLASVGVLLAAGCGNLANLLLVRSIDRQTEFAVRLSLGASRGQLGRLLLGESAALAVAGGAGGVGLAMAGFQAWRTWGPADFPQMNDIGLNASALGFAVVVSMLTALVCGVFPAIVVARDVANTIRSMTRTMTTGRGQSTVRRTFVAMQVAAATVLLIGMGIALRGFARLEQVTPGFTPDQALSVQLSLPPASYATRDAVVRFVDALGERLGAAGTTSAGAVSLLPLSGLLSTMDVAFPERPQPRPEDVPQAHFRVATPGYFAAAGIAVVEGRSFSERDRTDTQPVAIVSRTFADRHWPGRRAVGQFLQIVQATASAPMEVVGVVSDVKQFALDGPPTADLYVPVHQMPASQAALLAARMFWIVRAPVDSARLAVGVRDAVAHVDPGVAASNARTLETVWSSSLAPRRMNVRLLEMFGEMALALCALGIYAVAAYSARARVRELAIRAALGAQRRNLIASMLQRELWPIVLGAIAGAAASLAAAPLLFGTPYETSPRDATTYAVVTGGVLVLALIAAYLPVRRAAGARTADVLSSV